MFELQVTERKRAGKRNLKTLRSEGFMPAVIYGRDEDTTSIKVSQHDFKMLFKKAGESSIIALKGLKEEKEVLIQAVDFDPVTSEPRHADFYAIKKGKKLRVKVPLEFVGVAPAVKELGGILVKVLHELEIEVLPRDLPQHIEVDVSSIVDFEVSIYVKDIILPGGVEALVSKDETVASASPAVEEVEEVVESPDLASIEVEQKGKEGEVSEDGGTEEKKQD